ncbi:NUDIX domain-containing protein [Lysobacter cavernae]|uniref:NUDIX domain-containing protein n=1 Tax=Lysobacter cavernae TaxID=1685901 RepID=A0ABV7RRJ8_9GAMM
MSRPARAGRRRCAVSWTRNSALSPPGSSTWPALDGTAPEPWRLRLYTVTAWQGTPENRQPQEHERLRWCALDEAQRHLSAAHAEFPRLLALAVGQRG